jgi:hypothetical protein
MPIAIVIIPIMIVIAIAVYAAVGHADIERAVEPEAHYRRSRDPHGRSTNPRPGYGPDDCADEAVVPLRFNPVRIGTDRKALPIHYDRLEIEYKIVIGRNSYH